MNYVIYSSRDQTLWRRFCFYNIKLKRYSDFIRHMGTSFNYNNNETTFNFSFNFNDFNDMSKV